MTDQRDRLSSEVRDTFCLYDLESVVVVWLSREATRGLSAMVRRTQPAPHRWRGSIAGDGFEAVVRYVEQGRRPSRHAAVARSTWDTLGGVLPNAGRLAGTFPTRSGPNCFGPVMAACGIEGAEDIWMLREPFEDWLAGNAAPGGADDQPGTVLVWRSVDMAVQHAAVTLGDGWALHKPSQGWMSPTKILTVQDVKYSARARGHRLHRYRIGSS